MWQRARALLGTLVSIQVCCAEDAPNDEGAAAAHMAMEAAFAVMAHIGRVMSAHDPQSDVARLSQARAGEVLRLDPHTVHVIRSAQHWQHVSGGAFDPCVAASHLSGLGLRPGLCATPHGCDDNIHTLRVVSADQVQVAHPLGLDVGGIAKGYAVDQAIAALCAHGITSALVNAGGDMRAIGAHAWRIDVRHARQSVRDGRVPVLRHLVCGALATSVAGLRNPEFVASLGRTPAMSVWQSASVRAHDCMTADVLTKWALQSSPLCPSLRTHLRQCGARMWRSR